MVQCILAVLGLFVFQTLLPPTIRYLLAGPGVLGRLQLAVGPRDVQPPISPVCARAQRALSNMQEALPVFLTLALVHVARSKESGLAQQGALLFLVARSLYVPVYLGGVAGVRSLLWMVSWVGLGMMLATALP